MPELGSYRADRYEKLATTVAARFNPYAFHIFNPSAWPESRAVPVDILPRISTWTCYVNMFLCAPRVRVVSGVTPNHCLMILFSLLESGEKNTQQHE